MTNYYDILSVSRTASQSEIEKAYREQTQKHHADKTGDTETFLLIINAGKVLTDKNKRKAYDLLGHDTFTKKYGSRGDKRTIDPSDIQSSSRTSSSQTSNSSSESSKRDTGTQASKTRKTKYSTTADYSSSRRSETDEDERKTSYDDASDTSDTSSTGNRSTKTTTGRTQTEQNNSRSASGTTETNSRTASTSTSSTSRSSTSRSTESSTESDSTSSTGSTSTSTSGSNEEFFPRTGYATPDKSILLSWLKMETRTFAWESGVGTTVLLTGALGGILIFLFAILFFIVRGIIDAVLGLVFWAVQLIGVLSSNPLPNGILPDPYFSYIVEGIGLLGLISVAWFITYFLQNKHENHLQAGLQIPALMLLVPGTAALVLYGSFTTVPFVSDIVQPLSNQFGTSVLYFGTAIAAWVLTDRARMVSNETSTIVDITGDDPRSWWNSFPHRIEKTRISTAKWAVQIATVALVLFTYYYSLLFSFSLLPGTDAGKESDLLLLTPSADFSFTVLLVTALGATCLAVLYRITCVLHTVISRTSDL